jgi:hypothetical protein
MPIRAGNVETGKVCTAHAKDLFGILKYCGKHRVIGLRSDTEYRAAVDAVRNKLMGGQSSQSSQ